ncbi:MAG: efflux RND transporter periplasmic adaptor subunit [Bacteroides sp.]|nr:efflux RND transporter periplasmic adaptor subunit [Bacteroides sp.]MCM1413924.1 efflux RND transporter periplasmic adaptor subunit [Bacteroides sp.]MCM1471649.1 efflux RND transporter periplasmic adaptor subunit [Bacteroides sp.]
MKIRKIRSLSIVAGLALCVAGTSCGGDKEKEAAAAAAMAQQVPEVATMTVELSNADNQKEYPATLEGKTDIAIRPQVSGFITKVHVDEGQRVKKGQVLFTIDQVQFQAAVDNARAAVNSAQTAVNTAKMTADTKRQLFEKNIISAYDYQLAQNNLQTAMAGLSQAKAALTQAQKNLTYTVVTAPSDGVVGTIPNREGSLASPSSVEPLTTISDNSKVYAYFSLTEKDLLDMTDNGSRSLDEAIAAMPDVQLKLSNGSIYGYPGDVATVSGVINTSTGAASVRALFDNPSGMLRSGSTGTIIIPIQSQNVIVIPQKATFEIQDKKFVYVVGKDNKLQSKAVTVLPQSDGQNYVVLSGLDPGERIVVEGVGTQSIREGGEIKPVDAAKKAEAAAQAAQAQQAQQK